MTDRELLEAAARAADIWVGDEDFADPIDRKFTPNLGLWAHVGKIEDMGHWWNPLNNDGDALRLAVKLGLEIYHSIDDVRWAVFVGYPKGQRIVYATEEYGDDELAATRRAITRAAAAIDEGRQTK